MKVIEMIKMTTINDYNNHYNKIDDNSILA